MPFVLCFLKSSPASFSILMLFSLCLSELKSNFKLNYQELIGEGRFPFWSAKVIPI